MSSYLAVDLGAESGRLILGTISEGKLEMREIHRFANGMLNINGQYHWNIGSLYAEIVKGIEQCVNVEGIVPESIGIDTWGVDYGLLAEDGSLMGLPFAYRDPRTTGLIEEFCSLMPKENIYRRTGNLFASYNTLFQLFAAKKHHPKMVDAASDLLFIPDLLAYFLTGVKATEFSFATTSQLYNRSTNSWDSELFATLGISPSIMQNVVSAGATIGTLNKTVASCMGGHAIPVVAVATHDTASAIAAIPFTSSRSAFISSGTWSLMGIETDKAIITDEALAKNFTNEGGIDGRNYLLKNLMGLWVLQQTRRSIKDSGTEYNYPTLVHLAQKAEPFTALIDIDHESFLNPEDMCMAIADYCVATNQPVPQTHGQYARVVMESLALKYRETFDDIQAIAPVEDIMITGGGINNKLLCQLTADACQVNVTTVLPEGTAAGNLLTQAWGIGGLKSVDEIRSVAAASCTPVTYYPTEAQQWNDAYTRYRSIVATMK